MWKWRARSDETRRTPPQILLWGGTSQAALITAIVEHQFLGEVRVVCDPLIDEPTFEVGAIFVREVSMLVDLFPDITNFVVCIGGANGEARCEIGQSLEERKIKPLEVISEASYIDATVSVGKGLQTMPGSVINAHSTLGDFCIINSNATVEHDCILGDGVHVMSGATLTGGAIVGNYATVGANATVLPSVAIGQGALVGAGAVVTRNIAPNSIVVGAPATFLRYRNPHVINPMRKLNP